MKRILALGFAAHASAGVITVPDPHSPLPEGGSVVWSPLFQATWDAMNREVGGKLEKVDPPNELMARLDAFEWKPEAVMPEGAWKTWAGLATPDFLKRVNAEAARMTGEEKGPFSLSENPAPGTIACFGLLDREVEFAKPFFRSAKAPLRFGSAKSPVQFFGTTAAHAAAHGDVVKVLAYTPADDSHALEISCKGADDKVILYMPGKAEGFAAACRQIREWRKAWDEAQAEKSADRQLRMGDEVRVPYVALDTAASFTGALQGGRHYGIEGDPWKVIRAEQKTKFELHEKGARVRVEASLDLEPFGPAPVIKPRRFIYDRPFFVFLWRENAEWPYLGVWVGDTSALRDF
jgi:hypothetical protein